LNSISVQQYWSITAAHCTVGRSKSSLGLLVGDHNIATGTDTPYAALYRIESLIQHQNYSQNTGANDIALIRTQHITYK